jgi:hypothetical protein
MQEGEGPPPVDPPSDPKVRKKYARLIEQALQIEDEEPESALELYKYDYCLSIYLFIIVCLGWNGHKTYSNYTPFALIYIIILLFYIAYKHTGKQMN